MSLGYFPSFSNYRNDLCPLSEVYDDSAYVRRVKTLLSEIIDCKSPKEIHSKIGSHSIEPIRPDSKESKQLLALLSTPEQVFKIKYGNNTFRIYFSLSRSDNLANIVMIDTKHRFYR